MAAVTASLTAQNTGTAGISPFGSENLGDVPPYLNLSISGTWTATIWLQRSFDGGSTWLDVESFTANIETGLEDYEKGVIYRLFCKTGGFTSGTVVCRLSNCDA